MMRCLLFLPLVAFVFACTELPTDPEAPNVVPEMSQLLDPPTAAALPPMPAAMYATGNYGTALVAVDLATGATTTVGPFGTSATWGTAFTPDGTLWTVPNWGAQLATVDLTTGAATIIGPTGAPYGTISLEADVAGNLFAGSWNGNFYSVDKTTGTMSLIGNMGFANVMDFAFDLSGKLWAVNASNNLYSVDPTTGAGQFEVSFSGPVAVMTLAVDADDNFYLSEWVNSPRLFRLDPTTGATTFIGNVGTPGIHGGDVFAFNRPPDCSAAAPSLDSLWPPNHQFVPISVLGVTDPDGDPVTISIDAIWQDEPTDTYGDGQFTPDGMGVGTSTAAVRAERAGAKQVPGNGRVYHISFTADDGQGGFCSSTVLVGVPHNQAGDPAVDDGPLYDSTI